MNLLFDGYLTEEGNTILQTGSKALKINMLDAFPLFDGYLTEGTQLPFSSNFKHLISATARRCRNVQTKVGHETPLTRQFAQETISMLSEVL